MKATDWILVWVAIALINLAAYITNAYWVLKNFGSAITLETVLAAVGIIAAPLGILHGFYVWIS
jgi:hypothetical protein